MWAVHGKETAFRAGFERGGRVRLIGFSIVLLQDPRRRLPVTIGNQRRYSDHQNPERLPLGMDLRNGGSWAPVASPVERRGTNPVALAYTCLFV